MAKNQNPQILEAIKEAADSSYAARVESTVRKCIMQKHSVLVRMVYDRWSSALRFSEGDRLSSDDETGWEEVVSLSALRKHVGGRFQLLRERWVNAGLPLKEHRGTVLTASDGSNAQLQEFFLWLEREGFDVRQPAEAQGTGILFQIRKHR